MATYTVIEDRPYLDGFVSVLKPENARKDCVFYMAPRLRGARLRRSSASATRAVGSMSTRSAATPPASCMNCKTAVAGGKLRPRRKASWQSPRQSWK